MNDNYIEFDNDGVFKKEIQPILDHLKSLMIHYDIPFFFAAALKSDEKKTEYTFESHDRWSSLKRMKDDKIPGFIQIAIGFKPALPDDVGDLR